MKRTRLLLLVTLVLGGRAWSQSSALPKDGVAYSLHGALFIKDASGKTVRVIKTTTPIGSFAISPDRKITVFAPPGPEQNGGPLYLLSFSTGRIKRLTHTTVYDKREVYAYPDFSPDGRWVVFAIHAQPRGDAVITSGPYGLIDLKTEFMRVLPSTGNIDNGYGPAYGSPPRWSPNGQRIFVNLEGDLGLTSPSGKHLLNISMSTHWITPPMDVFAVDWLGNSCVTFIGGKPWKKAQEQSAWVLNLRTHRTERLDKLLGVAPVRVTNLLAFSPTIMVRKVGNKLVVETQSGTWNIEDADPYPNVRVFSAWTQAQVPTTCR